MRIVGQAMTPGLAPARETEAAAPAHAPGAAVAAPQDLASDVLKPAKAALAAMPEVDLDKVAALKDALARGEIQFDPDRLAQLVNRFHGGRG